MSSSVDGLSVTGQHGGDASHSSVASVEVAALVLLALLAAFGAGVLASCSCDATRISLFGCFDSGMVAYCRLAAEKLDRLAAINDGRRDAPRLRAGEADRAADFVGGGRLSGLGRLDAIDGGLSNERRSASGTDFFAGSAESSRSVAVECSAGSDDASAIATLLVVAFFDDFLDDPADRRDCDDFGGFSPATVVRELGSAVVVVCDGASRSSVMRRLLAADESPVFSVLMRSSCSLRGLASDGVNVVLTRRRPGSRPRLLAAEEGAGGGYGAGCGSVRT